MTYIVAKSNGLIQASIKEGTIDTSTSLKLLGKNTLGYGQAMAENLLHLLENFANDSAPTTPVKGQIWYNSATDQLHVYNGAQFVPLVKSTIAGASPTIKNVGDAWWDTTNKLFKIYDGANWLTIGPSDLTPYAKLAQNNTFTENIVISKTLAVGALQQLSFSVAVTDHATIKNSASGKDLLFGITLSTGTAKQVIKLNGSTGQAEVDTPTSNLSVANKKYIDDATTIIAQGLATTSTRVDAINTALTSNVAVLTNAIGSLQQQKANINSPTFTGTPRAPTPATTDNSTNLATTAFVKLAVLPKANIDSPDFTGTPTAPTLPAADSSNKLATTAFVQAAATLLATEKANINSPALTGTPTAPTPLTADSSTKLATTAFVHSVLPRGAIIMWSGNAIPSGWALCDGTNGTPDLRNRFVVGSGGTYNIGATGGSTDATVVAHSHTAGFAGSALPPHFHVISDPGHDHSQSGYNLVQPGSAIPWYNWGNNSKANNVDRTGISGTGISINPATAGTPAGTVTVNSSGGSGANANLPPYYALAYIMKVY